MLRFYKQDIKGLAPGLLEWHKAKYGGLIFSVRRYPKKYEYYPGPGIKASVSLVDVNSEPYFYKAKTIKDAKAWCRGALCYILKGQVPFGDHN